MQTWPEASDLTPRIWDVRAAGSALEDLRSQLVQVRGRGSDIAADTRWKSAAMAAYERDVGRWCTGVADLVEKLGGMGEEVARLTDEMVLADLLRSAVPGTAVAR